MTRYTVIFFYSNGTTDAHNAESFGDAITIEDGVVRAWYSMAMLTPIITRNYYLTGMVIIDNELHYVIENTTYL